MTLPYWAPLPDGLNPAHRQLVTDLRGLKDTHRLTFKQMGRLTHYSHASWERWLNGKRPITEAALTSLAIALGIDCDHLLGLLRQTAAVGAVVAEVASEQGGPVRPTTAVPSQLPPDIGDFAGRRAQVEELLDALTRTDGGPGRVAIATVTGGGGLGKTTLAVHVAHQVAHRFPDGQLYTNLHGADQTPRDPAEVAAGWLRALGDAAESIPTDPDERAARLRSRLHGRRVLILMDNAGDAEQVRSLLPGSGESAVLTTSRSRLTSLPGAHRVDLEPLSDIETLGIIERIVNDKRLTTDPQATTALLNVCGGLLLAARIAGARLAARPVWTVAHFVERLLAQPRVLDALHADGLAVRTTLRVSYDQLQPDSARAFRLLGLLGPGHVGSAAAAALLSCDPNRAEQLLEQLVDVNLLLTPQAGRYQFHDLVRMLAHELVHQVDTEQERSAAVVRLASNYLYGAHAATAFLAPSARRVALDPTIGSVVFGSHHEANAWCVDERDNVVAVVKQAAQIGRHDLAWKLAASWWAFHRQEARTDDWLVTHTVGLESARLCGDPQGEAWMLTGLGSVRTHRGEPEPAAQHLVQALRIHRAQGDLEAAGRTLNNLGILHHHRGDPQSALEYYAEAGDLFRRLGTQKSLCSLLNNRAATLVDLGRQREALDVLAEAEELQRALGDTYSLAINLTNRAEALLQIGRPSEATAACQQALAIREANGDRPGIAFVLLLAGDALADQGDVSTALDHWKRARGLFRELADPTGEQDSERRIQGHQTLPQRKYHG